MNQRKLYVPQGFYGAARWEDKKSLRRTLDMARAQSWFSKVVSQ